MKLTHANGSTVTVADDKGKILLSAMPRAWSRADAPKSATTPKKTAAKPAKKSSAKSADE